MSSLVGAQAGCEAFSVVCNGHAQAKPIGVTERAHLELQVTLYTPGVMAFELRGCGPHGPREGR